MKILSHRGYWKSSKEKNSPAAFSRSFDQGFGTETDLRDHGGRLVISHDMPTGQEISLDDFLEILSNRNLPLAINIKSDGLAKHLKTAISGTNITDWFIFDMSIPEMRCSLDEGLPVFARMSEVEKDPAWIDEISGIWLDSFRGEWYENSLVQELLREGLRICIVSPELHGRNPTEAWKKIAAISSHPALMLCTDWPERARSFFGE